MEQWKCPTVKKVRLTTILVLSHAVLTFCSHSNCDLVMCTLSNTCCQQGVVTIRIVDKAKWSVLACWAYYNYCMYPWLAVVNNVS